MWDPLNDYVIPNHRAWGITFSKVNIRTCQVVMFIHGVKFMGKCYGYWLKIFKNEIPLLSTQK